MMLAGGRTMPGILKPVDTRTDMFHVFASFVDDQKTIVESVSPLISLTMFMGIQDEKVETVQQKLVNYHHHKQDRLKIKD